MKNYKEKATVHTLRVRTGAEPPSPSSQGTQAAHIWVLGSGLQSHGTKPAWSVGTFKTDSEKQNSFPKGTWIDHEKQLLWHTEDNPGGLFGVPGTSVAEAPGFPVEVVSAHMLPGAERDSQGSVPIDHPSQSESLLTEDMALQKDTHGWGHWDLAARDEIKR
jgi:hypothetical protein